MLTFQSSENNISYYGTTSFHCVWEKVLQHLFEHDNSLISNIGKPLWKHEESGTEIFVDTLKPDIITIKDNIMYILDSKYYNTKFEESGSIIKNNPGVNDIIKQFIYKDCFFKSEKYKEKKMKYINAFVMPTDSIISTTDGDIIQKEATIKFYVFQGEEIILYKINAVKAYEHYLNENKIENIFESL